MEKQITINISKDKYPKLFDLEEHKLQNAINYILNIGYQYTYSSRNEKSIIENMKHICREFKDDIIQNVNNKEQINKLDTTINKLFGLSNTSNKKGELSENIINELITNKFPNYSYDVVRHIGHNADGVLVSPSGLKSLIEIKNYNHTVNKDEVIKFKNDLKSTNTKYGLFISFQTNIQGKKLIDYEQFDDIHIIYISKVMNDLNKIDCGILLLESIYKISKNDNLNYKINQIKKIILNNFDQLDELIGKIKNLRHDYNLMEKSIKSSLDNHYNKLREYELDVKEKMQIIWSSLFKDLKNIDKNYLDNYDMIKKSLNKKSKSNLIFNKLLDFCKTNIINITLKNKLYELTYMNLNIGTIKKMSNKIQVNLNDINLSINLENNKNLNKTFNFLENTILNLLH